jgi:hypothetical protein
MLFHIDVSSVRTFDMNATDIRAAAQYAIELAARTGGKVIAVYEPGKWPPPEGAPGPLPKPPTGPTPGTPTINAHEQTEANRERAA